MPLPKGITRHYKKFRAKIWRGRQIVGPSRVTVAAAQEDLSLLQQGLAPSAPARTLPRYVQKVKAFAGRPAGFRAQRKLQGQLVQGPWRAALNAAVTDAAAFATAMNLEGLLQKKAAMTQ